jgi:hypothetical protein
MKIDPPIKYALYQVVIYISSPIFILFYQFSFPVKFGGSSFEVRERDSFMFPKEINYLS